MKSITTLTICLLVLTSLSLHAQQKLASTKEVHAQTESFIKMVVENKVSDAFNLLKTYWPIEPAQIDELSKTTETQIPMLTDLYGELKGYEFVRSETVGKFAHIEHYVLKYEKSAVRFYFSYYNSGSGWMVNSMMWDDNWELLYKDRLKVYEK